MRRQMCVALGWLGTFLVSVGLVGASNRITYGCMAEYRSPDWQVANSPLIVIGEIEKIEDGKVSNVQIASDVPQPPPTKPTVATVRIVRVLKGQFSGPHLRIGSGPIRNCAIWEVHYAFQEGRQMIFILPAYPNKKGEIALLWGSSMRPPTDMQMVETRIARSTAYRDAYLSKLKKERPKIYAAAVAFAKEMRECSKKWPEMTFVEKGKESILITAAEMSARGEDNSNDHFKLSAEYTLACQTIAQRIAATDIEVIRAANAIEWLGQEEQPWWDRYIWKFVMNELAIPRESSITSYERTRIRGVLTGLGVEKHHIDAYMAAAKGRDTFSAWFSFPPQLPYADFDKETQSTHFILQCSAYDRGALFADYAIHQDNLANLDPARVGYLIKALYHDDDENLRSVAESAISHIRGTAFVDVVLDDIIYNGQVSAWKCLIHRKDPKETTTRLAAMIDLASARFKPSGVTQLWHNLRGAECFEPICIEKAVAALEATEEVIAQKTPAGKAEADRSDASDARQERNNLVAALRQYLEAAKSHREEAKPPKTTPAEYRLWFKSHPAPLKKDE
jgi:hypothetical protein